MKKYLFLISSVALLASCSNELMIEESTSKLDQATKGLTFQVAETKGLMNTDGTSKFFAEQDRVVVYANNAKKFNDGSAVNGFNSPFYYKATKSNGNPLLTGINDGNILKLAAPGANNISEFVVMYPADKTMAKIDSAEVEGQKYANYKINGVANKEQKYTSQMNFDSKFMIGKADVDVATVESYEAVGENIPLHLSSPFAMLFYSITDVENYALFGGLQTIAIAPADADASPVALSDSAYTAVASDSLKGLTPGYTYNDSITYIPALKKLTVKAYGGKTKEPVTLKIGGDIKNGQKMNAFVLSADRQAEENYVIKYTFENVDLAWAKSTDKSWEENSYYDVPLTIATQFPYIITKGTSGNARTLYVNSGEVKNILTDDGNIKWTDEHALSGVVDPKKIDKIIIASDVKDLDADDFAAINKCTEATSLEIKNNTTTMPDKALDQMNKLVSLEANNIESVGKEVFANSNAITDLQLAKVTSFKSVTPKFENLVTLDMSSYDFAEEGVLDASNAFFNDSTKKTLKVVDIEAVESLSPIFGFDRNILFTDYKNLKKVTLNATKTIISANEFKNCINLETVEGVVEMTTADSAFANCPELTKVAMLGDIIPVAAFMGDTKLKDVVKGTATVVPSEVGSYAFYGAKALENMDLSKATKIGVSAFQYAAGFVGKKNAKNGVVTLNVKEVSENAFDGTAIVRFQLKEATSMEANSLNSTALRQVKIRKAIKASTAGKFAKTNMANVDLFVISKAEADKYIGYKTVTIDNTDWED